jgi:diguanylate cyclase (GGDEF)-like protein
MELKNSLVYFLHHIIDITGVEAVGIRLHNNGDFPFYVYDGYSNEFIKTENQLCSLDKCGKRIPLSNRKTYELDCICGNIIRGRFDPCLPFFTESGSFFTNSTSHFLATTTEKERQGKTRNYCNFVGYESLAIVPIGTKIKKIGVIHVADKRKNMFTETIIRHLEIISEDVGYEIKNNLKYTRVNASNKKVHLLNKKFKQLANTDPLTGLLNRRSFLSALSLEKKRSRRSNKPFTLIMADIDYFKKINDELGHNIGDKVLIKIAKILKDTVREIDIVSRWGGDEFLILLPETSRVGGATLADKICKNINFNPLEIENKIINFTMSFGVSECSNDSNFEDCVENADKSLFQAKNLGRNKVVVGRASLDLVF